MDKMDLKDLIKKEVNNNFSIILEIRRYLHKNPELSFKEFNTSNFIQEKLTEWGISFETGFVKTGIKAILQSGNSEKEIALRADMDALPIQQSSVKKYCSVNDGIMHACGHDAHTASLLGSLKILQENKHHWEGKIVAIFQPGEEVLPGGAKLMLQENVFPRNPDLIVGQHVYPDLETGKLGFRGGQYMASCDEIHLSIKGKGGHAALPHTITDTVLTTAQVITNLQQIVSRKISPYTPAVLSFGYVFADGATNVIPNEVKIKGTFRCMNEHWREIAHKEITKIVNYTCKANNAEADLEIRLGYPSLINDENYTAFAKEQAIEFLGAENVVDLDLRMTAEDFSYYSQEMPACFYRFGTAQKGKESLKKLHHPEFDIEEDSLKTSVGFMTYLTIKYFKNI